MRVDCLGRDGRVVGLSLDRRRSSALVNVAESATGSEGGTMAEAGMDRTT